MGARGRSCAKCTAPECKGQVQPTQSPWGEGCHLRMCFASHSQIATGVPAAWTQRLMFGDQAGSFKNTGTEKGPCFSYTDRPSGSRVPTSHPLPISSRQYLLASLLGTECISPEKELGRPEAFEMLLQAPLRLDLCGVRRRAPEAALLLFLCSRRGN